MSIFGGNWVFQGFAGARGTGRWSIFPRDILGSMGPRVERIDHIQIGTKIYDPFIDYAKLASSMGIQSAGPVTNPMELASVIKRGLEVVKGGEPFLIDTVTQPR